MQSIVALTLLASSQAYVIKHSKADNGTGVAANGTVAGGRNGTAGGASNGTAGGVSNGSGAASSSAKNAGSLASVGVAAGAIGVAALLL